MLFNSWQFVAFLAALLALTAPMARYGTAWRVTLLIASYYFYAQWDWRYCGLILLSTVVDYGLALAIDARRNAKRFITASIIVNLLFLGFFKYADFLITTLDAVGVASMTPPHIVLPVGISFFTFQAMSYTIDVYRGELPARRRFLDYALFVAFFPQLLAGPIVRAKEFFTQLDRPLPITLREVRYAVVLIAFGLVKKIVCADTLAAAINPIWDRVADATPWQTLCAVYGFALQIYFDFSGYTDVAIGVALLLGFRFPKNFDYPYLALSLRDFWRRWHMTLSRWLRDYLYVSLGGNRLGVKRAYASVMITMLLGGLWHGASWNFVVWGGLHGAYLAFERSRAPLRRPPAGLAGAWRWWLTFHWVCFAWIFFRSPDFATSFAVIGKLAALPGAPPGWMELRGVLLIGAAFFGWQIAAARARLKQRLAEGHIHWAFAIAAALLALVWFTPVATIPFIYFQF